MTDFMVTPDMKSTSAAGILASTAWRKARPQSVFEVVESVFRGDEAVRRIPQVSRHFGVTVYLIDE